MDGVHDMGGMHGFGPVQPEENEPVFHAPWEGRVLAINRAMGYSRTWNGDMSRFAKEMLPPATYLDSPYYKKWMLGLEWLTVKYGLVGADEYEAGRALRPGVRLKRKLTSDQIDEVLGRRAFHRPAPAAALFAAGDAVRMKNIHPPHHTRLPRYVRNHTGVVERVHECHVFPDANGRDAGEDPQWVYTVCFTGRELWGEQADPTLTVSIDAFEPYLEPV